MIHAIKRGLLLNDFNELSVGMILDYITQHDFLYFDKDYSKGDIKKASQDEFDQF